MPPHAMYYYFLFYLKSKISFCAQKKNHNSALGIIECCLGDYATIVLIREINYQTLIVMRFSLLKGYSIKHLNTWEF